MTTNEFMAAYLEGCQEVARRQQHMDEREKPLEELLSELNAGLGGVFLEISRTQPSCWRIVMPSGKAAEVTVLLEYYVLEYLHYRDISTDIPELRDALLEMLRNPEMH